VIAQRLGLALLLMLVARGPAAAFETQARAVIMIDYRTGSTLFAKEPDLPIPPASMSKLMTAYVIFDALRQGRLKMDDTVPISEAAWKMGGSQMFLEVGERVPVKDLLRGIIIQSGNDACVAMAEALSGSEAAFAEAMNQKAKELGLTNSHFVNSTGLDDPGHLMSVRDLATLARRIIHDFPDYYRIYSEKEFTYANIRQPNRNPLLQAGVPGVDGIKTGFTDSAGYGLVTSAKRGDRRIILVVAGLNSLRLRGTEAERILEYGFRDFEEFKLYEAGQTVRSVPVWLGAEATVPVVANEAVAVTLPRDARAGLAAKLVYDTPIPAPVTQGRVVGRVEVTAPGMDPLQIPLVTGAAVPEAGALGRLTGVVQYLVGGAS
jgi:D-alanyl-D-alanine carboxypeptidase (penicillin-binding protein 5/6)